MPPDLEAIDAGDIDRLCDVVHDTYGYDFSRYQRAFLARRLHKVMTKTGTAGVPALAERISAEPDVMAELLGSLSLSVTEMFRDPGFFLALRAHVIPRLRTYPMVRVWTAGCATGQEPYSVAIMLEEEGLAGRYQIYATDMYSGSLDQARTGVIAAAAMPTYTRNYHRAGGKAQFSDYYTTADGYAMIRPRWRENIVFARHNLVTDSKFNEFNLILCRNVLIYFDEELHKHVHRLLYSSLGNFGVLGLGARESLRFSPHANAFETIDGPNRLYRRLR